MKKLFFVVIFSIIFSLIVFFICQVIKLVIISNKFNNIKQRSNEVHNELNYIYEKYDIENELKDEKEVIYEFKTN